MEKLSIRDKRKLMNKKEVVDSAERLIFSKGYVNATMDEIAKEAGMTKRTVYSYYNSKEEIYNEIIIRGEEILNNLFLDVMKEDEPSEINKIRKMGYVLLNFERNFSGYYKAIFEHDGNEEVCEDLGETTIGMLQRSIELGIEKGEIIETVDIVCLSLILWSSIIGFVNTFSRKEDYINNYFKKEIKDVINVGFDLILNSIKK